MIRIDRCICAGRLFCDLVEQAQREGLDLDGLMAIPGSGNGGSRDGRRCGLCRPYLREALRTGQTVFHQLLTGADRTP